MKYPNILWITVDACRKDMLYDLPYIKKISEKSIVFENAFANAPRTLPSVSSMFTGLYPSQHGALNEKTKLKKNVKTIAEVLSEKGYDTTIITQNDGWITPYYGLTRGFKKSYDIERMIETVGIKFPKLKRGKTLIRFFSKYFIGYDALTKKLLRSIMKDAKEPWFVYLHLMDTHMPYEPPSFPPISIIRRLLFYRNWNGKMQRTWIGEKSFTERELELLRRLYQKSMKHADKQIQEYAKLLDNETLLIITADHVENVGEYGMAGHRFSFHDTLLNVPLLIYASHIGAKRVDTLFETKDIFYLLQDIVEGHVKNFYEKDYIFGESMEIESVFEKLKKLNPNLSMDGKFIRTNKVKYIRYSNGKEEIHGVSEREEKIKNPEVLKNMRMLLQIKEKGIQRKSIGGGLPK